MIKKDLLKNIAFQTLILPPRLQLRRKRLIENKVLTVLNFHRVSPNSGSTYGSISPAIFDKTISYLSKKFHICLFNEIDEIKTNKPKLVISFDDGYKDFMDYAVPILDKYKVRVNQNIIPYCIESGLPPVNVLLQDFIGKAPFELIKKIPIDLDIKAVNIKNANRASLGREASFLIKYLPENEFIPCRDSLLDFLLSYPEFLCASVMTKKDVLEISTIHELGAHSFEHLSMETQSHDYFLNDLKRCKEYFLNELNIDCDIYAFPNGSASNEQVLLAKRCGFEKVLLVGDTYTNTNDGVFNRFTFDAKNIQEAKYKAFGRSVAIK